MPGKPVQFDMTTVVDRLKMRKKSNHRTVLFLGSRAGGLFRSQSFYEDILAFSKRTFDTSSRTEQFGECHRVLSAGAFSDNELYSILIGYLRELPVSEADICLAEFVKQDLFDVVISTNIDDLLEQAFIQVGMKEPHDYDVFIPGRRAPRESTQTEKRYLVKLFGDLSAREYNISKQGSYLENDQILIHLLESHLARDVLMVGFDPVWDEEILQKFPVKEGSLWFVNEEDLLEHALLFHILRGRRSQYLFGRDGSYENFWKGLYWHFHGGTPSNYQTMRDTVNELKAIHKELPKTEARRA